MIHEGENLREWIKQQGQIVKIAKEVGLNISWLNRRFQKEVVSTVDKDKIIEALGTKNGIKADMGIFEPKTTVTQTNKRGSNYQGSTHNQGSNDGAKIQQMETRIAHLEEMLRMANVNIGTLTDQVKDKDELIELYKKQLKNQ